MSLVHYNIGGGMRQHLFCGFTQILSAFSSHFHTASTFYHKKNFNYNI